MLQELPCVECVRHREPTPLPTNMTSTAILRVCSGSLAATRKGRSRACHFGTTFKSWCKIFFACGGHQVNFLSRLGPGSSPGRAESQLASELGELPLLGSQRVAVQQLPCPTAAATGTAAQGTGTGNAAGEQQVQPAGATSTSAALSPPWRQQPRTMPPPLCRRRRCRLCCCCRSVCRLSLVCTHTLKNCVKCPDVVAGPGRPETILC
jgi:hypothetical protein